MSHKTYIAFKREIPLHDDEKRKLLRAIGDHDFPLRSLDGEFCHWSQNYRDPKELHKVLNDPTLVIYWIYEDENNSYDEEYLEETYRNNKRELDEFRYLAQSSKELARANKFFSKLAKKIIEVTEDYLANWQLHNPGGFQTNLPFKGQVPGYLTIKNPTIEINISFNKVDSFRWADSKYKTPQYRYYMSVENQFYKIATKEWSMGANQGVIAELRILLEAIKTT